MYDFISIVKASGWYFFILKLFTFQIPKCLDSLCSISLSQWQAAQIKSPQLKIEGAKDKEH